MESKHKAYLKANLVSLFFIAVSFISVTLAWFAYSGLASVSTDIGVKAWYIELSKDNEAVSNDIVITLADIYPGMETVDEIINIKNSGDSDAQISYKIDSVRILGDPSDSYYIDDIETTSEKVEDILSHDYPFHINMNLNKNFILAGGEQGNFEVSISWPLDSDTDSLDSLWGNKAYNFQREEEEKQALDSSYQVQSSIKVVISLKAEQYVEGDNASDLNYPFAKTVLYDVVNNTTCTEVSATCLNTRIIDFNNKLSDQNVTLLPDVSNAYVEGNFNDYNSLLASAVTGWNVPSRALTVNDLLYMTSKDVLSSKLVRPEISDSIIGSLTYNGRFDTELNKALTYGGHYRFSNQKFIYLASDSCIWTNSSYNDTLGFALQKEDLYNSKIYGLEKATSCKVVPIIIAPKANM